MIYVIVKRQFFSNGGLSTEKRNLQQIQGLLSRDKLVNCRRDVTMLLYIYCPKVEVLKCFIYV